RALDPARRARAGAPLARPDAPRRPRRAHGEALRAPSRARLAEPARAGGDRPRARGDAERPRRARGLRVGRTAAARVRRGGLRARSARLTRPARGARAVAPLPQRIGRGPANRTSPCLRPSRTLAAAPAPELRSAPLPSRPQPRREDRG